MYVNPQPQRQDRTRMISWPQLRQLMARLQAYRARCRAWMHLTMPTSVETGNARICSTIVERLVFITAGPHFSV